MTKIVSPEQDMIWISKRYNRGMKGCKNGTNLEHCSGRIFCVPTWTRTTLPQPGGRRRNRPRSAMPLPLAIGNYRLVLWAYLTLLRAERRFRACQPSLSIGF